MSILDNVGEKIASQLIGQDPVTNEIPNQNETIQPSDKDELTRGGIYYSQAMPKGSGKMNKGVVDKEGNPLSYNEEMWNQMVFARDNNVKSEELDKVTDYLVDIGYLDKDDPRNYDSKYKNREWLGAIKRYQYNFSDDTMPMPWGKPLEAVKRWMRLEDESVWDK